MKYSQRLIKSFFILVTLLALTVHICPLPIVHAHRITVISWPEGQKIHVEARFSNGKIVKKARTIIKDKESGKIIADGEIGAKGAFSFIVPPDIRTGKRDMTVIVDAGSGHRAETIVRAADDLAGPRPEAGDRKTVPGSEDLSTKRGDKAQTELNQEIVRDIVSSELDRKLAPIRKILAESRSKSPGFTEIAGGIGYIFGIFGIILYFKSRKKLP
ncbi:MAG TPA: hypothetical protein EYP57_07265 [Thermodesulfobacteriaceae bacterium]|nr:hypothetical protein [Thermodesulfobacteriaceae bacterium]